MLKQIEKNMHTAVRASKGGEDEFNEWFDQTFSKSQVAELVGGRFAGGDQELLRIEAEAQSAIDSTRLVRVPTDQMQHEANRVYQKK